MAHIIHIIVSSDWFILFTGIASIISLFIGGKALYNVNKVTKQITKNSYNIKQSAGNNSNIAGRDIHG
ncbi:hypothetical protein [Francisella frigiditurris]|uniref:Uncharacterized protein n=1 Tax=Francisella frigiditurris TaxID=1542390 RepID=A0A1J0KVE9_9GAMM|nr:hypothetical protein [Francisella frigiditurris]APC97765.1 hypothetical protein KX01_1461 [Francisella frigiditurris]